MKEVIILTGSLVFIVLLVVALCFYIMKNKLDKVIDKIEVFEDNDETLMIRYNYVINIKKLECLTNELLNSKVDVKLLNYTREYIDKLNSHIYDRRTYAKTINFENEMLYKDEIINLDVVFYAFNHLFNNINRSYIKILNNEEKLNIEIQKNEKNFKKTLRNYKKKSQCILKDKNNKDKYYLFIEEMKDTYKNYISKLNPVLTLLFIKHGLEVISQKNEIN